MVTGPTPRRTIWIGLPSALALFMGSSLPLTSMAEPSEATTIVGLPEHDFNVAALASSKATIHDAAPPDRRRLLGEKIAEARAILQELLEFADTAQTAIRLGDRLKAARLANRRLKQNLQRDEVAKSGLERFAQPHDDEINALTHEVVANWLISTRLADHQIDRGERLAIAASGWHETERRAHELKDKVEELHAQSRELRVESTALAAELGHIRRHIRIVDTQTHLAERQRLVAEAATAALLKQISAVLRTILASDEGR